MRSGIENFPLWSNREVRQGERKWERSERKGIPVLRTFSETNGSPLFQSQMGHKAEGPRAVEILPPSAWSWKLGERERDFTQP